MNRIKAFTNLCTAGRLACVVFTVGVIAVLGAQISPGRVALGPLDVALGDDQLRTLDKLRTRYSVSFENGPSGSWAFRNADESGHVDFRNGRLIYLGRVWKAKSVEEASQAFVEILNRLITDGHASCQLKQPYALQATDRPRAILLLCGTNRISLDFVSGSPTVIETLIDAE